MKNLKALLLMVALLIACEQEATVRLKEAPDYFPLNRGIYQIYDVDETTYLSGGEVQALTYELKVHVTDSFPSEDDSHTYVLHRSKRSASGAPWNTLDTWSVRRKDSEYVVTEGNTPYVKITVPYYLDRRWNGNAYNTQGEDEYTYTMVDGSQVVNGMSFERALEVQQEANSDRIVFRDERKEIYAAGVGLVYKEVTQHHFCTDDPCLGQEKIEHGTEIRLRIKEYGKM